MFVEIALDTPNIRFESSLMPATGAVASINMILLRGISICCAVRRGVFTRCELLLLFFSCRRICCEMRTLNCVVKLIVC